MKAILPAAGFGTRFLPLSKAVPKEMLPLGDRPVVHYVVEEAVRAGFDEILIILGVARNRLQTTLRQTRTWNATWPPKASQRPSKCCAN